MAATLERVLAAHHVPDVEAPANFSLFVAPEPEQRGPRELHVLYRSRQAVARSRQPSDLVHTLLNHLAGFAQPQRPDRLRLDLCVAVAEAGVILLPAAPRRALAEFEAALRRRRVHLQGVGVVELDVESGELVVPDPSSVLRTDALDELGGGGTLRRLGPGHHRVAGWALAAPGLDELSRAQAVALAVRSVDNVAAVGSRRTLEALGRVFSSTVAMPVLSWHTDHVADGLDHLLARLA